ncbi:proton-coupled zinc antiporter SLC30A1-like [Tachypleus tridentatus]|uniref:proton-coupled zinc antiporter SLC30A1-like n=1 Tax=Tachypleus tridentatus TaxID=6853 RepID=UPI003FD15D55
MRTCKDVKLYIILALSSFFVGAELVASHFTKSLVLLADSYHMLYNVLSLLLLIVNYNLTKERTLKNTFGWARVEVFGVLVNMLLLVALCFPVCVEALQTMVHVSYENTQTKYPAGLLVFGAGGLCLNFICIALLGGYTRHQSCYLRVNGGDVQVNLVLLTDENTNKSDQLQPLGKIRCASSTDRSYCFVNHGTLEFSRYLHRMLDLLRDTCSCVLVIIVGCFVLYFDDQEFIRYTDPVVSLVTVVVLISTNYHFIKESGMILLQTAPDYIDVQELTKRLLAKFPIIRNVHDLHVWRLTGAHAIATVHIILDYPSEYLNISHQVKNFFQDEGIAFVTVQPEFFQGAGFLPSMDCVLQCSESRTCRDLTCCGPLRRSFTTQPEEGDSSICQRKLYVDSSEVSTGGGNYRYEQHSQNLCDDTGRHKKSTPDKTNADSGRDFVEYVYYFENLENSKETAV